MARILRFDAELAEEENRISALLEPLAISRSLADRPAIAATLMQSAELDTASGNFRDAEDNYLRALLIRHQLGRC